MATDVQAAVSPLDYALLSAWAHYFARDQSNVPDMRNEGWETLDFINLRRQGSPLSFERNGFEGVVMRKGNNIVVALAGTDELWDTVEDITTYFGIGQQLKSSAELYLRAVAAIDRVKAREPDFEPTITFTGHSLGGGLASVVSVMFDRKATVFDTAPFFRNIDSIDVSREIRDHLITVGTNDPYLTTALPKVLADMQSYHDVVINPIEPARLAIMPPADVERYFAARTRFDTLRAGRIAANLTGYNKPAEFLSQLPFVANRIGAASFIPVDMGHFPNDYDWGGGHKAAWDMHAGTMWATYFYEPRFADLARKYWHLIPELYDPRIEYTGYEDKTAPLEHFTYSVSRDGNLLSAFLDDIARIDTDLYGGQQQQPRDDHRLPGSGPVDEDTRALRALIPSRGQAEIRALIQIAIHYYSGYPASQPSPAPLFESAGQGGVVLSRQLLSDRGLLGKAGTVFLGNIVDERIQRDRVLNGDSTLSLAKFQGAEDWVIATRVGAQLQTRSTASRSAFAVGLDFDDHITGSAGQDILVGFAGRDRLDGRGDGQDLLVGGSDDDELFGDDGDRLYGGQGFDRYKVTGGVTIQDHDGKGAVTVMIGGKATVLTGGRRVGSSVYYRQPGTSIVYLLQGDELRVLNEDVAMEPIKILKWKNKDLGITLTEGEPDPKDPPADPKLVPARADPLVLDLDGDGLESIGPDDPANQVFFDIRADGIPRRTGWVLPDDAFLALDRNGNGRIDDGGEVFGDATPLPFGGTAIDGFDALRQVDDNDDGWVDDQDAIFGQLRLWRDLNQNGVSEPGELKTLAETGVAGVRVTNTGNREVLANGNRIADLGVFRWADGREGDAGAIGDAADIDLALDLSRQQLPPLAVDPALTGLPVLLGRGAVRSLHEAATQSPDLAARLREFGSLNRADRQLAIDELLYAWARTSDMTPLRERGAEAGVQVVYDLFQRPGHYFWPRPGDRPFQQWPESRGFLGWERGRFDAATWAGYEDYFEQRIFVIEAFGGDYMHLLPEEAWPTPTLDAGRFVDTGGTRPVLHISWAASHLGLLVQQRYEMLRQQVYEELLLQSRLQGLLQPLFDAQTPAELEMAFAGLDAQMRSRIAADVLEGIGDLIDVNAVVQRQFGATVLWQGPQLLAETVRTNVVTPELFDLLQGERVNLDGFSLGAFGSYTLLPSRPRSSVGQDRDDTFVGTSGRDFANGSGGDDALYGGGGNDELRGDDGDDLLEGGTGDDWLLGGAGSDTYRFRPGDGRDTVSDSEGADTLQILGGVRARDITLDRDGTALVIHVGNGSGDRVTVAGFYDAGGRAIGSLNTIEFDDGSTLDPRFPGEAGTAPVNDAGLGQTLIGTPQDDRLDGQGGDDTVQGLAGNDTLLGGEGRDRLEGGDGDDLLQGQSEDDLMLGGSGQDSLEGGTGDDRLEGGEGDDALFGGSGRDHLAGGAGNDAFHFRRDDGYDRISDATRGDSVVFGPGIGAGDLRVVRAGPDLVLQLGGSSDKLVLEGWFASATPLRSFAFDDGTVLDDVAIRNRLGEVTDGNDAIAGSSAADTLSGGSGNDLLSGADGNDVLTGGFGDDVLAGGSGNDIADGGTGDDLIDLGAGSDTLRWGPGAGRDTLIGVDTTAGKVDRLVLPATVRSADLSVFRAGDDLVLQLATGPEQLRVVDQFKPAGDASRRGSGLDRIEFSDGSRWTAAQIATRAQPWTGPGLSPVPALPPLPQPAIAADAAVPAPGAGDDQVLGGGSGPDTLNGGTGDDQISGGGGNDTLTSGAGMDLLDGGEGDDVLDGGTSRDTLIGGPGSDSYRWRRGDGADRIVNQDASASTDTLNMIGVPPGEVWVRRNGDDLVLFVGAAGAVAGPAAEGTGDAVTVVSFFAPGGSGRIDAVRFDDGTAWSAADLEARTRLVSSGDDVIAFGDGDDRFDAAGGDDRIDGGGGNDQLAGGTGADRLTGGSGNDTLLGGSENDLLDGGEGNDDLSGGGGDDILDGGAGDDVLRPGDGNDVVKLGAGRDVVHYTLADGQVVIEATDPAAREVDTLRLGPGITPAVVRMGRDGDNLALAIDEAHRITVTQQFTGSGNSAFVLERIEFADGTVWTDATLRAMALTGTPGNDTLFGFDAGETLDGLAGSDSLDGRAGDDVLIGGLGNDQLAGGEGSDTYRFAPGWGADQISNGDSVAGRDRIVFDAGVLPAAVTVRRSGDTLVLTHASDSLLVWDGLRNDGTTGDSIQRIAFADGTTWDLAELKRRALLGTPRDDRIDGHDGDDVIEGGAGNDRLSGRRGNDTYVFGPGFGQDFIDNVDIGAGRIDRIRFSGGIQPADVRTWRYGNNLYLAVGSDIVTVASHFSEGSGRQIDEVRFDAAPGVVWDLAELARRAGAATDGDDYLVGTAADDRIDGLGGQDTILGESGNDTLLGGPGADTLYGGAGDDTLDGGVGDDVYLGGPGRDRLVFARGGGADVSVHDGTGDVVDARSLNRAEVRLQRQGPDLVLALIGSTETLTIYGHFQTPPRVVQIEFADSTLDAAAIEAQSSSLTPGDDLAYGSDGDDVMDALAGNDTVHGLAGNDRLLGNTGNDTLIGGPGNDTFVYRQGDGNDRIDASDGTPGKRDVIELGAGIDPAQVAVRRGVSFSDGDNLTLLVPGGSIVVPNGFAYDGEGTFAIQEVRFADGSTWRAADLRARSLQGTAADESLLGFSGNDELYGRGGNDTLNGNEGSDNYHYARGDGNDRIWAFDLSPGRIDSIVLAAGLQLSDLTLRRAATIDTGFRVPTSDDLVIEVAGGGSLRVVHHFDNNPGYRIDRIVLADGTVLGSAEIAAAVGRGTPGDDILIGGSGPDVLDGLAGTDVLRGEGGDDQLTGGPGNDTLDAGTGNDRYHFAPGWGQDLIAQNDPGLLKSDEAVFAGINRGQASFTRNATDLTLTVGSDSLRIADFFLFDDQPARQIDRFVFSDGVVTPADIRTLFATATEGDDVLWGTSGSELIDGLGGNDLIRAGDGNDTLRGGSGNDELRGQGGNDILDGGSGDDLMAGGPGSDTYRFGNGRGNDRADPNADVTEAGFDRVLIDDGLTPADIGLLRNGFDLLLRAPDGSTLRLLNFLAPNQLGRSNSVEFADGTVWNGAELLARSNVGSSGDDFFIGDDGDNVVALLAGNDRAEGRAGNDRFDGGPGTDRLFGEAGDDTLDGGAGDGANDELEGGPGNDRYVFGSGDGNDLIRESPNAGSDEVQFRSGITPAGIVPARQGDDLVLTAPGGATLRVNFWFLQQARVERFVFADGTVWMENDVLSRLARGTEGDDELTGTLGDDVINALGGRDRVFGRDGNDVIDGGAGDDWQLDGEGGNDTVRGGEGRDYVIGGPGNDQLFGDAGDDTLESGTGDDVLEGGAGIDQLRGWAPFPGASGNTTYRFGPGWGLDTISDSPSPGTIDTIEFFGGLLPADIVLRYGFTLPPSSNPFSATGVLLASSGSNSIQVYGHSSSGAIERVRFVDGGGQVIETWDAARIALEALRPTAGDDRIGGTAGDDVLVGGDGNDTLVGLGGNNRFDGGNGNDLMVGAGGADTYVVRAGFGQDRVRDLFAFGQLDDELQFEGMPSTRFTLRASGNDLVVSDNTVPGDQVTIEGYFGGSGQHVETLRFSNATWRLADVLANLASGTEGDDDILGTDGPDNLQGLGGNDRIRGRGGDDLIDGGSGNDRLEGGFGADTVLGGDGDDRLYGAEDGGVNAGDTRPDLLDGGPGFDVLTGGGGADTFRIGRDSFWDVIEISSYTGIPGGGPLSFGPPHDDTVWFTGTLPAEVTLLRFGSSTLRAFVEGGPQLELLYQFNNSSASELGFFRFDDGTVWDRATWLARTVRTSRYDDYYYGSGDAETADGGAGNDRFEGNGGADVFRGGEGDDVLYAYGSEPGSRLYGDNGNDRLYDAELGEGGSGDDQLVNITDLRGGTGNDLLIGGGNDTIYRFAPGDGSDTVDDSGGDNDRIVFEAGIAPAAVRASIEGNDLIVRYGQGGDRIRLLRAAEDLSALTIERFEFADGSVRTQQQLLGTPLPGATDGDDELDGTPGRDVIDGRLGNDTLRGLGDDDILLGGEGNDTLEGGAGSDSLLGGEGNDRLDAGTGGAAPDVLDGGPGNDTLIGHEASTTVLFEFGDGRDTVEDLDEDGNDVDTLILRDDADSADLRLRRDGDDLLLQFGDDGIDGELRYVGWFAGAYTGVDRIQFLDFYGTATTTWNRADIALRVSGQIGTDGPEDVSLTEGNDVYDARGGNDRVQGLGGDDKIDGGEGDDDLDGGAGNDTLISHQGWDFLNGSDGADTYRIGADDGGRFVYEGQLPNQPGDEVVLDAAIARGNVQVEVDGVGVKLTRTDAPNWSVSMYAMLDPRWSGGPVESVRFESDGTVLSAAQILGLLPAGAWVPGTPGPDTLDGNAQRNSMLGGDGNDTLRGLAGDDWLYGGRGDDDSSGGTGNDWLEDQDGGSDIYRYARGDGSDLLIDGGDAADTDRLVFAAGIATSDVRVARAAGSDDLELTITSGGSEVGDSIRIIGWFGSQRNFKMERIEFAGSTVWTAADIDAFIEQGRPLPLQSRARPLQADVMAEVFADAIAAFVGSADDIADNAPQRGWLPISALQPEFVPRT